MSEKFDVEKVKAARKCLQKEIQDTEKENFSRASVIEAIDVLLDNASLIPGLIKERDKLETAIGNRREALTGAETELDDFKKGAEREKYNITDEVSKERHVATAKKKAIAKEVSDYKADADKEVDEIRVKTEEAVKAEKAKEKEAIAITNKAVSRMDQVNAETRSLKEKLGQL